HVLLCDAAAPTPAIAHAILRLKTDGAINFTASHNPAEYHGIKFSGPDGAPALPEVTRDIEERVARLAAKPAAAAALPSNAASDFQRISPRDAYLADRKSTRLNSSHGSISYAVFCLKKKKQKHTTTRRKHTD